MKKVIVSTHDSLFPMIGGGALRTLKVAEEFKKRGFDVIIVAPTNGVGELNNIKVHWLHPPKKQRSQILSSLKFNVRLMRKFLQFIKDEPIFFVHNTIAAATLPFLKKIFKFKFILDITDIHAEYLHIGERNLFEKILTPFMLKFEYYIIKSADNIIAVTEEMKKLLISKGISSNKIGVVYDGVDKKNFSSKKDVSAETGVIHLGTIDRQQGVELLLEAIPIVLNKIPKIKFYFVGGGRELNSIKKRAWELKIIENCIFTDYVEHNKVALYLSKATIGVIPRKDYLPNRIITTLKVYEYWASGTAVISSCLKGINEIAVDRENILFFSPGDAEDLAKKIILLLEDKNLKNKLIVKSLSKIDLFDWDKLVSKIIDIGIK